MSAERLAEEVVQGWAEEHDLPNRDIDWNNLESLIETLVRRLDRRYKSGSVIIE